LACGTTSFSQEFIETLENLIVLILPIETQAAISAKIQSSFALRTESEKLLALAKEKV
jgi:hypothetical protein